jgi:hypothetical protein
MRFHLRAALSVIAACIAAAALAAPSSAVLDGLKLNEVRMEGSHNSYRPYPSPATEQRIKTALPAGYWDALAYGHPPLESQLALGLHQFEIDVAADPDGGLFAGPYADATPQLRATMAAPGAKVVHIAGVDYNVHCLTFRACLGIFARWSDAHPGHDPIVILINSVDQDVIPGYWPKADVLHQADIDALNTDVEQVMGRARVITPDDVRGAYPTLREAVVHKAWPQVSALRGRFLFVLDGSADHEIYLRTGPPSLRGRMMFGWFDEDQPEAAFFNIGDPLKEFDRIHRLVEAGFMVRTRADENTVEARHHDGRRMQAALDSGAQIISTDYYAGVPDPEGIAYIADFKGPMFRCDEVTAKVCPMAGGR